MRLASRKSGKPIDGTGIRDEHYKVMCLLNHRQQAYADNGASPGHGASLLTLSSVAI